MPIRDVMNWIINLTPNSYVEVLTTYILECDSIWRQDI